MCKHRLKITIKKTSKKPLSISEFKRLSWIERYISRWFRKTQKVMLLIPEECANAVDILEVTKSHARQNSN